MARYLGASRRRWIFWRQHLWEVDVYRRGCTPMSPNWPKSACWLYREPTLADCLEALERLAIDLKAASSRLQQIFEATDRLHINATADDRPDGSVPAEKPYRPKPRD